MTRRSGGTVSAGAALGVALVVVVPAGAKPQVPGSSSVQAPASLDSLLREVLHDSRREAQEMRRREQKFVAAREGQKDLLAGALAQKSQLERRAEQLEERFAKNDEAIGQLEARLAANLGTLGELFGVVRQVAGDTRSLLDDSLISARLPNRSAAIASLAQSKKLPSLQELEGLWFHIQQEMTESGKVTRFSAPVVLPGGAKQVQEVVGVGPFSAVSSGKYLRWMPALGHLVELPRQPAKRYLETVSDLEQSSKGVVRFAVDPSRGSILSLLVNTPAPLERIQLGGVVGYGIIGLGVITALVGLVRLILLVRTQHRVRAQRRLPTPKVDNPLGRLLSLHRGGSDLDAETLERRLDEAIIRETNQLERALWAIKVVCVVAPLMGLLGTVTGMIRTFQAITLFGTGDPKLMASGISEALVTTMLGLVVAIPLVLLHSALSTMTRRISGVLEEQSAGMIAARAEEMKNVAASAQ